MAKVDQWEAAVKANQLPKVAAKAEQRAASSGKDADNRIKEAKYA